MKNIHNHQPSLIVSLLPILILILGLISVLVVWGGDAVQNMSQSVLLVSAALSAGISLIYYRRPFSAMRVGLMKSAGQILPTLPILLLIATVSATWMMSGVVPTLICYGLEVLNPRAFLLTACAVCAVISVLSGSSWTTIATIGVAFMGIGTVWGYSPAWIAGAIISGAYFGDKVSPLSDTTVLASSSCGVELFAHIRYLMWTSIPAMLLALIVFGAVGLLTPLSSLTHSTEMIDTLHQVFNITPWTLVVPCVTVLLIVLRCKTLLTLGVSTLMGVVGMIVFQPDVMSLIAGGGDLSFVDYVVNTFKILCTETSIATGDELLDSLVSTGGIQGMMPTVYLILSAMVFGGVLMGSGMLGVITHAVTRHIRSSKSTVITTVGTGLMLNACTGDQYLSIILNGNLYRNLYHRNGLEPRLLSRSIEDSTSVTSVLIPWNSCGLTQSAVLGVATLHYLPYCIFNIASPLISIATAWVGFRIKNLPTYIAATPLVSQAADNGQHQTA